MSRALAAPTCPQISSLRTPTRPSLRLLGQVVGLVLLASITLAATPANATLGVAKDAMVSGQEVTLDFYLENLGGDELTNVLLVDDLDVVFGEGNYTVTSPPSLESGPATLTLNPVFGGASSPQVVSGGTLAAGAVVQVRVVVEVNALIDPGSGFGVYSNQASGEAMGPGGSVMDLSDNGTDPDPNGNGDPTEAGEDDPTPISITPVPELGIAKNAAVAGREVTLDFFVENLGNVPLDTMALSDDLDTVFGAGNYSVVSPPMEQTTLGTLVLNASFDGSGDPVIISGGTLAAGALAQITLVVEVTTFVDLGSGLGVYSNQVTISGEFLGAPQTDLSTRGTDPDPDGDGDPAGAGEDEPTPIIFFENPIIGAAKNALLDGTQVTFDIVLENFGNGTLTLLSLPDNLDAVFGAGNYSLLGAPTFTDDPGTITLNAGFDGSSDTQLITSGTLAVGDTAGIRIVVDVTNIVDLGSGMGVYSNQVTINAQSVGGREVMDLSDNGTEPDANGDGDPNDPDENDPTVFAVGQEPQIGVAKNATVIDSTVTLDFYLENLGNVDLVTLDLADDLDAVFGANNYMLVGAPSLVDDPGTITLDPNYDGSEDTALISSGTLAIGDTAQIQVVVRVTRLTDQGSGLGNYSNQVSVFATTALGANTSDVSDDGTDPDPNGNGDPTEAGENDATLFTVAEVPVVGVSKQVTVVPSGALTRVIVDLTLENLGNVELTNLTLVDDLNAVYGPGNYIHTVDPSVVVIGDGSVTGNVSYNGSTNTDVITGGNLGPGSLAEIRFEHLVVVFTDQGLGLGVYSNQATGTGDGPSGGMTSDLSDDHPFADPNQNGDPTEAGEDDPTIYTAGSQIGVAKDVSVVGSDVTIDLYLEAFGLSTISNLSLADNLAVVFGVDAETMTVNYTLTTPPFLVDDPGTINLDPAFDGNANQEILAAGSTLAAADTAQIRFVVRVDKIATRANNLGVYTNQVQAVGETPTGEATFDLSDAGIDPDPNGNGAPGDFGENDPTVFTVTTDAMTGAAKTAMVGGSTITLDFYLENFGTMTSTNLALVDDLDAVFGAGNYSIVTPPSFIDDPGTLVLDGSYDGGANTNLLAAGSTLAAGDTAQIQMVVNVTNIADSQGLGAGVYSNQAMVTGEDSTGLQFMDLSDDGTDPDPTGDGDPTFPGLADPPLDGEDDPTPILLGGTGLGAALHSFVDGNFITYDYVVENLGDSTIDSIQATQTLFTIFGFGNFSVAQPPVLLEGPATIGLQGGFDGTFSTTLLFGGVLNAGERARIRFVIEVTNAANGPDYSTQFVVSGTDPLGNFLSDNSDDGIVTDPNGNGNASEAGEDDPTLSILGTETVLGVAKDVNAAGTVVTIDFYLENFGNNALATMTLEDDLDAVFGAGNYSITTPPAFIDDPGTLTLDPAFDGSANTALLVPNSSTLAAADTAQIRFVVTVTNLADVGLGVGSYENQVIATGLGTMGTVGADFSDDGTDPDPNGSGNPADAGEGDPSPFVVSNPVIGVSKVVSSIDEALVAFDFFVENLGNEDLVQVALIDNLDATFGAGNYEVAEPPFIVGSPREIIPNPNFDGSSDQNVFDTTSALDRIVVEQIRLLVRLTNRTDQGLGLGNYENQATAMALGADSGAMAPADLSDNGTDPDPNGNASPGDAGEDDPTPFSVGEIATIGVAKTASSNGFDVTFDVFLEQFGNTPSTSVALVDDLDAAFGAGNYLVSTPPSFVVDPGTLVLNGGFNGGGDTALLAAGSSLGLGATAQIQFVVTVTNVTDQGLGLGLYNNQASVTSTNGNGIVDTDLSDDGTDPDPDGDFGPDETGENDPTQVILGALIGDLVWDDRNGDGIVDAGEPGIDGVTVFLDLDDSGAFEMGEPTTVTAGGGLYQFRVTTAGTYTVFVDDSTVPANFLLTTANNPTMVTVGDGENFMDADFGYRAQADLSLLKADSPDPVTAGNNITYSLTVQNAGPNVAPDATVFDVLPEGTTYVSDTAGCTQPAELTGLRALLDPANEVPPVASTASGSATFVLDTDTYVLRYALHVTDIDNITAAHIHAGAAGVNGAIVQVLYGGTPLFDPTAPVTGRIQLTEMEAMDLLANPHYVNVHTADFAGGEIRGQIVTTTETPLACPVPAIPIAGDQSFDIVAAVASSQAEGSSLENVAIAVSSAIDPTETTLAAPNGTGVLTGATANADTAVVTSADLSVSKTDLADPAVAGTNLTYTVEVSNAGPSDALNVVATDTLPAGVSFVSTTGCAESPGAGVPTCTLGTLVAGGTASYTITVAIDPATLGTITNTVSVATSTTDPNSANDSTSEDTVVAAQTDISVTKVGDVDPVVAGQNLTYTVTLTNNGPSNATGVAAIDTLPAGTTFDSSPDGCVEAPVGTVTCTAGALAVGAMASFDFVVQVDPATLGTITNTVNASSATTDPNAANDTFMLGTTVQAEATLSLSKSDSPDPVVAGSSLTYSLSVLNGGPSVAGGTMVYDLLPEGTTFQSATATCTQPAELEGLRALLDPANEVPPVASTASGSATFVLDTNTNLLRFALHVADIDNITAAHIHAGAAGVNGAVVQTLYAGAPLFDPSNPISGTIQLTAMEAADLLANPHYVNVHTTDFAGGEIRGQIVAATETPVACDLGDIDPLDMGDFDLIVSVDAMQPVGSTLVNVAIADSAAIDPGATALPAPNGSGVLRGASAIAETTVATEANLSLSKTDSADPAVAGTNLTYTLTVTNPGPSDAQNVVVTETLPAGVTLVSTSGCAEDPLGAPTCTLGTVVSGGNAVYTVTVAIDPGTLGTITNNAQVTTDTDDPGFENDFATEDTLVVAETDLSVTKAASDDPATAGTNLTYSLTVANAGPSNASGVVLTDTLPANTGFVSSPDGCVEGPVGTVTCNVGALANGANATRDFVVLINADVVGTITNNVVVSGTPDPNPANDSFSLDTTVEASASLALTKSDDPDPVVAGGTLTYGLSALNTGPSVATGTMVYDLLPDSVTFQSATAACTQPTDLEGLRALLDPANEVPPVTSTASGSASFVLDTATNVLRYAIHVADIDNITAAHIHAGAAGVNGAVVQVLYDGTPLFDPANPITGRIQLTAMEAADLLANPHYVNVHTTDFAGGEIRGQIVAAVQDPVVCDLGAVNPATSSDFDLVTSVDASQPAGSSVTNVAIVDSAVLDPNEVMLGAPNGTGVLRGATAIAETAVIADADLSVAKTDDVDPVVAGTGLTYTVEVSNAGPSDAQNVVVTDTLPGGVTLVSTTGCAEDPNGVPTCTLGTLAAGDSVSYTVMVTVDSGTLGTIQNNVAVTSDTNDSNAANDTASEDTSVIAEVDLSITKGADAEPATAGTNLTYTLTVANAGPSDATAVVATDTLPAGTSFVSSPDGCVEGPVGTVTCNLGTVAAGGMASADLVVAIDPSVLGTITNNAAVSSATNDTNAANDTTTLDTTVEATADLALAKIDDVDPVAAGTNLIYTLTVSNAGPSTATAVTVTETLPAEVTLVATSGCVEDPNGVPTCTLGTILPGAMAQYTVEVTVDAAASGTITNMATVATAATDPNSANDTATEDTLVTPLADLAITKIDSKDPVAPGDTLTYTIDVTNLGPSVAPNVVITDTLPDEVTLVSTTGCTEDPNGVPTCSLGDIAVDDTVQITIEVTVDLGTPSGTITNTATVASDAVDPDPANNEATEDTLVDAEPPTVVLLDSLAGDGEIEECEEVRSSITQLLVSFSEPVQDPAGDGDADDVTNPANYLLVEAGPDRDFSTVDCSGPAGDDAAIGVTGVAYDDGTDTATLTLDVLGSLGDDLYRLLVCGSTSIRDIAGNPLDGDADGTGGDDFVRTYRVERLNPFVNAQFDCTIDQWVAVTTLPAEAEYSSEDIDDSSVSGSAELTNLSASNDFSLGQCIPLAGGQSCTVTWNLRLDAAPGVTLSATRVCEFFSAPACGGTSVGADATVSFLGDSGFAWLPQELDTSVPAGAVSALCSLDLRTDTGDDFNAFLDNVRIDCSDNLFTDGFESGDTSAWSGTTP